MRNSKFSGSQIAEVLKEAERGAVVAEIAQAQCQRDDVLPVASEAG